MFLLNSVFDIYRNRFRDQQLVEIEWTIPEDERNFREKPRMVEFSEDAERAKAIKHITDMRPQRVLSHIDDPQYVERKLRGAFHKHLKMLVENKGNRKADKSMVAQLSEALAYRPRGKQWKKAKRLLFTGNWNSAGPGEMKVPVYCDLPMMSSDHIFSIRFANHSKNVPIARDVPIRTRQPAIGCDCNGRCKIDTCKCMQAQRDLFRNEVHHLGNGVISDHYDYDALGYPVIAGMNAVIMCGDLCSCDVSCCSNHVGSLDLHHNLEVFRHNQDKGFGLRTLNHIEMDQIATEFLGVVKAPGGAMDWDPRSQDYAFELFGKDAVPLVKHLAEKAKFPIEDFEIFQNNNENAVKHFYIDPLFVGNEARFVAHSCTPNVEPIRVISNFVHPAHHRIFFKALFPIPPGTELTFDYGEAYLARHQFKCQCGTPLCKDADKATKAKWHSLKPKEFVRVLREFATSCQGKVEDGIAMSKKFYDGVVAMDVPFSTEPEDDISEPMEEPQSLLASNTIGRSRFTDDVYQIRNVHNYMMGRNVFELGDPVSDEDDVNEELGNESNTEGPVPKRPRRQDPSRSLPTTSRRSRRRLN